MKNHQYNVSQEPIVLSKITLDILLQQDKPADLLALYAFYYYTAKWQGTDVAKATTSYAAIGLKWSETRVRKTKKVLIKLKLVEDVQRRGFKSGKVVAHCIKVNFIWHKDETTLYERPQCGKSHSVENFEANALVTNNINALKTNSKTISSQKPISSKQFDKFWKLYPKKAQKGKALTSWNKLCNKPSKVRPTWRQIKKSLKSQSKSDQWKKDKGQFIPAPTTWLNQSRWLDDAKEMKDFNPKKKEGYKAGFTNGKPKKYAVDGTI